ncbi:unnamed protein product [Microthlaspi erraticum]|uniref:Uncharacterized protein n=1 Tax=Microthlaspi erraticum TaxID=1685480 RepID=A0A6D2JIG3_9BRAS|nr:unnamed protein product [Microthlaspi erraticum]
MFVSSLPQWTSGFVLFGPRRPCSLVRDGPGGVLSPVPNGPEGGGGICSPLRADPRGGGGNCSPLRADARGMEDLGCPLDPWRRMVASRELMLVG